MGRLLGLQGGSSPKLDRNGLAGETADALVGSVNPYVPLIKHFLAVASVLLSIAPGVGLVMALIAYLVNRKTPWLDSFRTTKIGVGLTVTLQLILPFVLFVGFVILTLLYGTAKV